MIFAIDDRQKRRGRNPHELAMVNLLLFNLLIGGALLVGSLAEPDSLLSQYKWVGVSVPLAVSLVVMLYTWWRAARARQEATWFVAAHWRLSARRYRVLLLAYLVSAAVLSLAFFGGDDHSELEARIANLPPAMQEMERHKLESQDMGSAIWARIGVVPLLLSIMALIMLESGALYQAGRGEVPDSLIEDFPPPGDLKSET